MISRTVEYALRAAVWLAADSGKPLTTRRIAVGTQVPAGYLAKVMQQLVDSGLVRSQRGLGGGFVLERPAEAITVLDVVRAVDPIERIRACPLGLEAHRRQLCPLHRKLDDALATVEDAFARVTLAELVETGRGPGPLCDAASKRSPSAGNLAPAKARKGRPRSKA